MANDIIVWNTEEVEVLPAKIKDPTDIAKYAIQLGSKDKKQIIQGFEAGNYEMAVNYVWLKSMATLKRELSTLGMKFLGEMINKPELDEDDDVFDVLTEKEAVRLAEELGMISATDGIRLRHVHELLSHFSKLDASTVENDDIEMDEIEAINALKVCVKNILGKPKIEVAKTFVEFREALESKSLTADDPLVEMLVKSPYFFHKLTISILMSLIKTVAGAKLEIGLSNVNLIVPLLWIYLRDAEKWQIGYTYRDVYSDGKSTAVGGLKQALLKVKGFDYVPENLRSDTFVKAAEAIIKAHEGMDNFYNEASPVKTLQKLGSIIPTPAFPICASALISVSLGNSYGRSYTAAPTAEDILDEFTKERWQYYLNECLPSDVRVLQKLEYERPRKNWMRIVKGNNLIELNIKNKHVGRLVKSSSTGNDIEIKKATNLILEGYYGKSEKK